VWVIGNLISPFQRWVIRRTGGRVTLTSKPVLLLTAIGRRSGRERTVPLLYLRDDENLIVCNVRPPWERRNPWPLNVQTNPDVTIRIRGVAEPRGARDARPDEIERFWPRLVALWPAYDRFFARTHERAIFVLEGPVANAGWTPLVFQLPSDADEQAPGLPILSLAARSLLSPPCRTPRAATCLRSPLPRSRSAAGMPRRDTRRAPCSVSRPPASALRRLR
jgi:deazaflavin-dependent oxidoreductase (nitroreductase family)